MPVTKARVLPSRPAAASSSGVVAGSSGRRRKSAVANAASAKTKTRFPHPATSSGYGSVTFDANRHACVAVPRDVVRDLLSQLRAREAAQPVGEAMSGDLDHDIAGLESGTVDGARHVDDDAVGPIERDDRAVRGCVEPHSDSDDTEQHQYDRDDRRCPAGEARTPGASAGPPSPTPTHTRPNSRGARGDCATACGPAGAWPEESRSERDIVP